MAVSYSVTECMRCSVGGWDMAIWQSVNSPVTEVTRCSVGGCVRMGVCVQQQ